MTKQDAINMLKGKRDDADNWSPIAIEALDMAISALERPLKIKLPPEKKIDRETHSGYWFAKGWNGCLEEIRDRM